MKSLAQETRAATERIGEQIRRVQELVSLAEKGISSARNLVEGIAADQSALEGQVAQQRESTETISMAVVEARGLADQMHELMQSVSTSSQRTSGNASDVSSSAESLKHLAATIQELISVLDDAEEAGGEGGEDAARPKSNYSESLSSRSPQSWPTQSLSSRTSAPKTDVMGRVLRPQTLGNRKIDGARQNQQDYPRQRSRGRARRRRNR